MATTATTPSELITVITSTIRSQTAPNSITPITHSDLLDNIVQVLSASTSTTGATLVGETVYFDRVDTLSAFTLNLSSIGAGDYLPLSGGNVTGGLTASTFSATTYYNLPASVFTGGTVAGATNFTSSLTANTLNIQSVTTGTSVGTLGIDSNGTVISLPTYKSYVALLTQSGASAPEATVLENSLGGTVVWSYSDSGIYIGTLSGAFTNNKTFCSLTIASASAMATCSRNDGDSVYIVVTAVNGSQANDALGFSGSPASIEIRVYN